MNIGRHILCSLAATGITCIYIYIVHAYIHIYMIYTYEMYLNEKRYDLIM